MRTIIMFLAAGFITAAHAEHRSPGKPSAPVRIEHRLLAEPLKGQPLEVEIIVTPTGRMQALDVEISGAPALQVGKRTERFAAQKLQRGESQSFMVRLVPQQDGVFDLDVRVSAKSGERTRSRSQSFEVSVGVQPRRNLQKQGTLVTGGDRNVVVLPGVENRGN